MFLNKRAWSARQGYQTQGQNALCSKVDEVTMMFLPAGIIVLHANSGPVYSAHRSAIETCCPKPTSSPLYTNTIAWLQAHSTSPVKLHGDEQHAWRIAFFGAQKLVNAWMLRHQDVDIAGDQTSVVAHFHCASARTGAHRKAQ